MAICPNCQRQSDAVLAPCPSGDGYYCIDEEEYYSHSDDRVLGRRIAERYVVQSVLGRGSMSRVYRAHQDQVDRSVALKVFRPETILGQRETGATRAEERERAEARFVQEAKVLGKLSHPNCVTVYDFGADEQGSFLFMAMEYVAGVSLRTAIRRGLKFEVIVEIARQVLEALREAHSLSIVHRDLKPENVILSFRYGSERQVVKVLDFGIAKLVRADDEESQSGKLFGTPAYMSPEQCKGMSESIGPAADIYAFGCVFYEMICGRLPFTAETPSEMVRAHLYDEVPDLQPRAGLELPDGVEAFVETALEKAPSERFSSAKEALGALGEVVPDGEAGGADLQVGMEADSAGGASRQVVVPENRVSGAKLDPLGREASETSDEGEVEAVAAGSVDRTSGTRGGGEEGDGERASADRTLETGVSAGGSGGPREDDLGNRAIHDTGAKRDDRWAGRLAERFRNLDRRTWVVFVAVTAVVGFCGIVFLYIYASISPT